MTQKRTYLPYEGGIEPKRLRIGSLYLDKFNPTIGLEKKRFDFREDLEEEDYWTKIQEWTKEPREDEPCSFGFDVGRESSFGASVARSLKIDWEKQHKIHLTLTGDSGRRFEIQKPMKFFEQEVFSQSGAEDWIQKQCSISVAAKRKFFRYKPWKAPDIWMLTGIQLIKGGSVEEGSTKDSKMSGSTQLDPGMAHGVQTGIDASLHGSHSHNESMNATYVHKDERVWAAQFMQLDVEFVKIAKPELPVDQAETVPTEGAKTRMCVTVKDVVHLGDNALRKPKDDKEDDDTGGEVIEIKAHIVGLKGPDALPSKTLEQIEAEEIEFVDEVSNPELCEIAFTGTEFNLEKYQEVSQHINWEQYDKYSKYWDDLEEWEKTEV